MQIRSVKRQGSPLSSRPNGPTTKEFDVSSTFRASFQKSTRSHQSVIETRTNHVIISVNMGTTSRERCRKRKGKRRPRDRVKSNKKSVFFLIFQRKEKMKVKMGKWKRGRQSSEKRLRLLLLPLSKRSGSRPSDSGAAAARRRRLQRRRRRRRRRRGSAAFPSNGSPWETRRTPAGLNNLDGGGGGVDLSLGGWPASAALLWRPLTPVEPARLQGWPGPARPGRTPVGQLHGRLRLVTPSNGRFLYHINQEAPFRCRLGCVQDDLIVAVICSSQ